MRGLYAPLHNFLAERHSHPYPLIEVERLHLIISCQQGCLVPNRSASRCAVTSWTVSWPVKDAARPGVRPRRGGVERQSFAEARCVF